MKTLKIKSDNLAFRDASLILGKELKAIKLNFSQAMAFRSNFSSFEEMSKHYDNKILKEGEIYKGYLAIQTNGRQELTYMDGILKKVNPEDVNPFWMSYSNINAANDGLLWKIKYPTDRKQGLLRYVWNFGDCNYSGWIKHLQEIGRFSKDADPEAQAETIKTKLIEAASSNVPANLTEEEYLVVKSYAPDYFKLFFSE